ncbi:MAG: ubiquinol-cytochrome C chaperone family protein [Rhizobiaceae bacterium]|nr:ubiquinol-cytochrome C chaperone family protein [Rhizobiaceae bacterium]
MLSFLFKKSKSETIPQQLYGSLMAQAREPFLYADFGVPDSVMGRFDMLALHVYLFARRLRSVDSEVSIALSQDVFDLFVADVERALRELGIGDTTVPKRKKKMVRSFYGQIEDFDKPLEEGDSAVLSERVNTRYLAESQNPDAEALANYMFESAKSLAEQPFENMLKGNLAFLEQQ